MNILQYSLGIYPSRQGGLVRYSTDLAKQLSRNDNIFYLMPGKLGIIDKKVSIKKIDQKNRFKLFAIDNAHPIPLFSGVTDVELYTKKTDIAIFSTFLKDNHIDIVHIHSLMGLHLELLQAAKILKIPVFFTTHDFYGICLATTLFKDGCVCDNTEINEKCLKCSQNAHSYIKLAIGQSQIYKRLKNNTLISRIRKRELTHKTAASPSTVSLNCHINYGKLNEYYMRMIETIDFFLFNSKQTRDYFERSAGGLTGEVIPLLHKNIRDNRIQRKFMKDGILHVGFMGECTEFKGYKLLSDAVKCVYKKGIPIELDVYNDSVNEAECIKKKGSYSAKTIDKIYDVLDVIVVPSLWPETLGFVAVEALAAGMPCIVSDHVGAKCMIKDKETGFILKSNDRNALVNCLASLSLNSTELERINKNILKDQMSFDFAIHCNEIRSKYFEQKKKS